MQGIGFKVQGSGFRVWGLGLETTGPNPCGRVRRALWNSNMAAYHTEAFRL